MQFLSGFRFYNINVKRTNVCFRGINLKGKSILRFYFSADSLNGALDNLILKQALHSEGDEGEACAQRIIKLIEAKRELSLLWGYLNGVMQLFSEDDELVLFRYAFMRCGISRLDDEERKRVRRVYVRFFRKAVRLKSFAEALSLVNAYYALIRNLS